MDQVQLDTSIGYALKRAQAALRAAMDAALRGHGLSVPQYSCLELLAQRPGISNAELARGVFVTRQATHQLLSGLRGTGLVSGTGRGRSERFSVTAAGMERLANVSRAIAAVEERMLTSMDAARRDRLLADLRACVEGLQPPDRSRQVSVAAGP